ncbi:MAG: hypothetical protein ACFE0K_13540 [Alcanivorax sp.]|uniref:hypothetical protein n=1 Tax=Alcanivorax sp. TaxID=1872427 RepID=UPI003DA77AFF
MQNYDPEKLLISIHIPKCGGTSFTSCLEQFFGEHLHLHYPDDPEPGPPPETAQRIRACVHGHFYHHRWAIGAMDYYPDSSQFITMLREPFEMALSGYYFRRRLGDLGDITLHQHLDELLATPQLFNYLGLPFDLWKASEDDIQEWLDTRFLWIGLTERFQESVDLLAMKLDKASPDVAVDNVSPRDDGLAEYTQYQKKFRQRYRREYALYDYANRRLDWELGQYD